MVLSAAVGYVHGYANGEFDEDVGAGLALGVTMAIFSALSLLSQATINQSFSVLTNLSLIGATIGPVFETTGTLAPVVTVVVAGLYGIVDFLIGWGIADIVRDVQGWME